MASSTTQEVTIHSDRSESKWVSNVHDVQVRYLTILFAESDTANSVSWQSAFWGLVPIALNSMTQPSGKVCGSPAGIGFLLRVSPFMCLFDALIVIVRMVVYSFTQGSLPAAIKKIIIQRYTDDDDDDASELRGNM